MQKINGFSLLEMMVVIALLAILSSLSYASWHYSLVKARQIDAQHSLYAVAVALEACYQQLGDYTLCAPRLGLAGDGTLVSEQQFYSLQVKQLGAHEYVLVAESASDTWELTSGGRWDSKD